MEYIRKLYNELFTYIWIDKNSDSIISYNYPLTREDVILEENQGEEQLPICPVCLGNVSDEERSSRISCHSVCVECADSWLDIKKECPMCRSLDVDKIDIYIEEDYIIINGCKVTPRFYNLPSCRENGHMLTIEKPFGVVVTCHTCKKCKGFNWKG